MNVALKHWIYPKNEESSLTVGDLKSFFVVRGTEKLTERQKNNLRRQKTTGGICLSMVSYEKQRNENTKNISILPQKPAIYSGNQSASPLGVSE